MLIGVDSLREELLNACAKEGRDCGMDMAGEKKKERTEPKTKEETSVMFGISQVLS